MQYECLRAIVCVFWPLCNAVRRALHHEFEEFHAELTCNTALIDSAAYALIPPEFADPMYALKWYSQKVKVAISEKHLLFLSSTKLYYTLLIVCVKQLNF